MNQSNKLLSDIVAFRTYAKYLPHLARRESLEETINRKMIMDLDKFGSLSKSLSKDIMKAYGMVHDLKIMPSMRGMQFAGEAVLKNNIRQYNCSYLPIDDVRAFGETLFLLLSGVGVGFSVQKRHVNHLPKVQIPREEGRFIIHDSIEGWAQAIDLLFDAYFYKRIRPVFDFSAIRPKGSYLVTTGAKAPGPEPLKSMLNTVESTLRASEGRRLTPLEVHDIVCLISDCVLAGGIRRAALISLFDRDDTEMLQCKQGEWWVKHPYRARANNSAVLPRGEVTKDEFIHIFKQCQESGSGEPGFSWTSNPDWGFNPCFTGDTLVAVADGRNAVPIKQLAEENYTGPVYTIDKGQVTIGHCSRAWKTRKNAELVKVTFDDGTSVKCTPDHRFMLRNGNYVKARDLKENTSLMPFNSYKRKDRDYRMIGSNVGKDFAQYRHIAQYYDILKDGYNDQHIHHIDGNGFNDFPKNLEAIDAREHNKEHMLGSKNPIHKFKDRKSYRKANSKARKGEKNPNSNGLSSSDMVWNVINLTIEKNRKLTRKETLNACNVKYLSEGRLSEMGCSDISDLIELGYKNGNHKVFSVEFLEEKQDVYDLTVDVTHNFAIITKKSDADFIESSGVFVHNCHEIALNPNQFCNLTTINQTGIQTKKEFLSRVYSATLLGTLQAAYTSFPYVRPKWQEITEREALLGVSFTGIADTTGIIKADWLKEGAKLALEVNEKYAKKIGTNPAARVTAIKPEGSASCVVGSSSGIHARHSKYYLRRVRMNKDDALANYLKSTIPELVEDDKFSSTGIVVTIPQASPEKALCKEQETAISLFKRAMLYNRNWVGPGHRTGDNKHNVSCTVSVKDNEWDDLCEEMWIYKDLYSGISLLPFDGGNYEQAPFEACTEEQFQETEKLVSEIDLKKVIEHEDNTNRIEQVACAGGVCEIV